MTDQTDPPPGLALVSVNSAKATAFAGLYELSITATGIEGSPDEQTVPFGWHRDDPYGLGPAVTEWMDAHPDFPVAAYVAPVPSTNPADYTLSKRQICAALILANTTMTPEAFMQGIIDVIADPTEKALALNDWANAPVYQRSNALFSDADLLAAANMTSAQVDTLWLLAAKQPA